MAQRSSLLLFIFMTWLWPRLALAEEKAPPHVRAELIVPEVFGHGDTTIGLRLSVDQTWRIVWNQDDSNKVSPQMEWDIEHGTLEETLTPLPERQENAKASFYSYQGEVILPLIVRPSDLADELLIEGEMSWQVCQAETCVTEETTLSLKGPVSQETKWSPDRKALLDEAMTRIPISGEESPWTFQGIKTLKGDKVEVRLVHSEGKDLATVDIIPFDQTSFQAKKPYLSDDGEALILSLKPGQKLKPSGRFFVSDDTGAWEFSKVGTAPSGTTPRSLAENEAFDGLSFLLLLLSAFVGGMILNLMPCVLPVLSIKFFSLARMNQKTRWHEIWLYSLGVLTTFTALGGIFLALRAGGSAVGWGFQLQSPPIVFALILLFWLMGLSFLGLFEFGNSIVQAAGRFQHSGAFATGILSVFVATPCTGPFMGTALGAAATLPAFYALTIFFFLGLGLAAPFLLLAVFPNIRLPKPGQWMNTLRQFLAFPLFATVLWLLWVLGLQLGTDAWLYGASLCLLLAFVIWLGRDRPLSVKALAWILALSGLVYSGRWVYHTAPLDQQARAEESSQKSKVQWVNFDTKLIESQKGQRGIFVDFTAAWCVTCQVNKKAVLETEAAETLFAKNDVLLIRADWTNLDESITNALAEFDRASVPLYLYYPKDGKKPKILPQILTMAEIEALFP